MSFITVQDLSPETLALLRRHNLLQPLARAELLAAFEAILERMDDIHILGEMQEEVHHFSFFLRPMKELNIGFTKK